LKPSAAGTGPSKLSTVRAMIGSTTKSPERCSSAASSAVRSAAKMSRFGNVRSPWRGEATAFAATEKRAVVTPLRAETR
jgi:hypothetical protein